MNLDEAELRDLSAFFGRRFPALQDRARLARAAGFDAPVDPGDTAWTDLVTRAHASGRLGHMVRAALRLRPDDARLQEMAALIAAPRRWPVVLGAAALAVVGVILAAGSGTDPTPPVDARAAVVVPAAPVEAPPVSPVVAAPAEVAPVEVAPALPVEVTPAPEAAPPPRGGRCSAPPGELVGYWYAGRSAPGDAGETITLRSGATVRSDYPRAENKYNFRFPERCALVAGDVVRLSQAPIAVTGGVYWVPLMGGDLAAAVE